MHHPPQLICSQVTRVSFWPKPRLRETRGARRQEECGGLTPLVLCMEKTVKGKQSELGTQYVDRVFMPQRGRHGGSDGHEDQLLTCSCSHQGLGSSPALWGGLRVPLEEQNTSRQFS